MTKNDKKTTSVQVFWGKIENGRFAKDYQSLDRLSQEIDNNWEENSTGKELQWNQIQGVGRGSRHC